MQEIQYMKIPYTIDQDRFYGGTLSPYISADVVVHEDSICLELDVWEDRKWITLVHEQLFKVRIKDVAYSLGASETDTGISWVWWDGFPTEERAQMLVEHLKDKGYDTRGPYPPDHISDNYSIRHRVMPSRRRD